MDWRRLGAWAGMVGTSLFMLVFLVQGWLQPGYDPRRMSISELALGPGGWIHVANIVFLGLTTLLLARGLAAEFPSGKASKAGPILLTIIGICAIGSGVFVTEPTTMPPTEWAWHGWVHVAFATVAFVLWPVLTTVYYRRFRVDEAWHGLAGWTLLVVVITGFMFLILFIGSGVPGIQGFITSWAGVLQRLDTVIFNIWLLAVAYKLYERSQVAVPRDTHYEEPLGGVTHPH